MTTAIVRCAGVNWWPSLWMAGQSEYAVLAARRILNGYTSKRLPRNGKARVVAEAKALRQMEGQR